jgi:hypothetical protein
VERGVGVADSALRTVGRGAEAVTNTVLEGVAAAGSSLMTAAAGLTTQPERLPSPRSLTFNYPQNQEEYNAFINQPFASSEIQPALPTFEIPPYTTPYLAPLRSGQQDTSPPAAEPEIPPLRSGRQEASPAEEVVPAAAIEAEETPLLRPEEAPRNRFNFRQLFHRPPPQVPAVIEAPADGSRGQSPLRSIFIPRHMRAFINTNPRQVELAAPPISNEEFQQRHRGFFDRLAQRQREGEMQRFREQAEARMEEERRRNPLATQKSSPPSARFQPEP